MQRINTNYQLRCCPNIESFEIFTHSLTPLNRQSSTTTYTQRIVITHATYTHTHIIIHIQRVMGFGICFTCGYLMTFMSFRLFIKLVEGNPAPFVFLYSSGNILSLMSSMFLSGPKRQFKSMFDEKRQATSITYLVALTCSITVCFLPIPTGPQIGLLVLREYFVFGSLSTGMLTIIFCFCNSACCSANALV